MKEDILQSEGWEKFQQALGRKTECISGVLAIEMPLPFGKKYWYAPRSEELRIMNQESWDRIRVMAGASNVIFLRSEGEVDRLVIHDSCFTIPLVLRRAIEPEWTWRTSLEGSDDELLDRMHEKHRYNIRLAAKRGVVVRTMPPPHAPPPMEVGKEKDFLPIHRSGEGARGGGRDFDACWHLLQETANRQGISTHPRHYYETMLATLHTKVYFAEYSGTPIACAIIAYHNDTATYLHGGSSYEHRSFMAPHLLHWAAMRDAREASMRWYEWGGIQQEIQSAEYKMHNSDWSGITRFKQGFGGETVHHPPMRDLVFQPKWYTMLSWFARLRR